MEKHFLHNACVIILNWNNWMDTLHCLDSLQELTSTPATIIVCDNGSSNDSPARILQWAQAHFGNNELLSLPSSAVLEKTPSEDTTIPPRFLYLQSDTNRGFAGGNNLALRWALTQQCYDYYWLLNNDTEVERNSLSALLAASSENSMIGIWGSTVCRMDDREKLQCAGGCTYSPATTIFKHVLADSPANGATHMKITPHLDYIYGASFFVRREVFENVGLLCEDYFLFYEELDFCMRTRRKGYDVGWCRESVVYHKGSASIGVYDGTNAEKIAEANYYENLGTLIITKKFFPHLLPIAMVFRFWGKIFVCCKRRQLFLVRPLLEAYRDFLWGFLKKSKKEPRSFAAAAGNPNSP